MITPHAKRDSRGRLLVSVTLRERLLSRLVIDPESGCLLWTGSLDDGGYGRIGVGRLPRQVHRVMWEMFEGPIPEGLHLDHVRARGCTNRHCASIAHLEPVTPRENLMRGTSPSALNARAEYCRPGGHEYTEENTYWDPNGGRQCRKCILGHTKQRTARRRALRESARLGDAIPVVAHRGTHCIHGHEYTPANTYVGADGNRECRLCGRDRARAARYIKIRDRYVPGVQS